MMKHNDQHYRPSGAKSNVTISDASIVFEHPDNEDDENDGRMSRRAQTIHINRNNNKRTNEINIQHISPIKSHSE